MRTPACGGGVAFSLGLLALRLRRAILTYLKMWAVSRGYRIKPLVDAQAQGGDRGGSPQARPVFSR